MPPLFSVITATHNAAAPLPRLLESLAKQTCRDFELVVQDGASKDGTLATLELYRESLPALHVQSEPDRGIYDAWNKAVPRTSGEWLLFLGADDALADAGVLAKAKESVRAYPPTVVFAAGDAVMQVSGGHAQKMPALAPGAFTRLRYRMPTPHTALFHRGCLFVNASFDAGFRIAGDYEFLCRTWKSDAQAERLDFTVTRMGWGGVSSRPQDAFAMRLEEAKAAAKHFPHIWNLQRVKALAGGGLIAGLCSIIGPRKAAAVLDRFRVLRGLPPCWGSKVRHE